MVENLNQIKSGIAINVDVCSKYLAGVIDEFVIKSDEIIEKKKTIPTIFNEKKYNLWNKISVFYLPCWQLLSHYT